MQCVSVKGHDTVGGNGALPQRRWTGAKCLLQNPHRAWVLLCKRPRASTIREGVATAAVAVNAFWGKGGAMEAASASSDAVWGMARNGCRGCRRERGYRYTVGQAYGRQGCRQRLWVRIGVAAARWHNTTRYSAGTC